MASTDIKPKKRKGKVSKPYYQLCPKCEGTVNIYCKLCKGEGHIYHPPQLVYF